MSQQTRPADKASAATCTPGGSRPPGALVTTGPFWKTARPRAVQRPWKRDGHISMDEPAIFRKSLQTWRLKVTEGTIPL